MERKDLMPDATKTAIVEKLIREQDVVRANEQDHDTAVLVRKLRTGKSRKDRDNTLIRKMGGKVIG